MQANPQLPQLKEIAHDLAQLQDFRLLFYVLIVMFVLFILERWYSSAGMRRERQQLVLERQQMMEDMKAERGEMKTERQEMWKVADKFSDAAKEWSEQTDKLVIELQVLRALTARTESTSGKA